MRKTPYIHIIILLAFLANTFGPAPMAKAQDLGLPAPGVMVHLSSPLEPPMLKGIKVHAEDPFRLDFILDKGDTPTRGHIPEGAVSPSRELRSQAAKLIKYFLASLTIPQKDLWVNLSPYEKDRIIPQSFGLTEMGRDLLAEDYMLKQITASLIYPEDETGKKFWKRIYEEAQQKFGTTNIPVNTFNKVWIVPEKAVVYENAKAGTAYVVESKLKVMLEQDYLSMFKHASIRNDVASVGANIVREIVIPELTKEINTGKNFAQLRQVYNSLILATWYKKKIKDSILAQVFADKKKVAGVGYESATIDIKGVYQRYLQAFKKGVYNYIKEDVDPITGQALPRKYFSGGFFGAEIDNAMTITSSAPEGSNDRAEIVQVKIASANSLDQAEMANDPKRTLQKLLKEQLTSPDPGDTRYPAFEISSIKTNGGGYVWLSKVSGDANISISTGSKQPGEVIVRRGYSVLLKEYYIETQRSIMDGDKEEVVRTRHHIVPSKTSGYFTLEQRLLDDGLESLVRQLRGDVGEYEDFESSPMMADSRGSIILTLGRREEDKKDLKVVISTGSTLPGQTIVRRGYSPFLKEHYIETQRTIKVGDKEEVVRIRSRIVPSKTSEYFTLEQRLLDDGLESLVRQLRGDAGEYEDFETLPMKTNGRGHISLQLGKVDGNDISITISTGSTQPGEVIVRRGYSPLLKEHYIETERKIKVGDKEEVFRVRNRIVPNKVPGYFNLVQREWDDGIESLVRQLRDEAGEYGDFESAPMKTLAKGQIILGIGKSSEIVAVAVSTGSTQPGEAIVRRGYSALLKEPYIETQRTIKAGDAEEVVRIRNRIVPSKTPGYFTLEQRFLDDGAESLARQLRGEPGEYGDFESGPLKTNIYGVFQLSLASVNTEKVRLNIPTGKMQKGEVIVRRRHSQRLDKTYFEIQREIDGRSSVNRYVLGEWGNKLWQDQGLKNLVPVNDEEERIINEEQKETADLLEPPVVVNEPEAFVPQVEQELMRTILPADIEEARTSYEMTDAQTERLLWGRASMIQDPQAYVRFIEEFLVKRYLKQVIEAVGISYHAQRLMVRDHLLGLISQDRQLKDGPIKVLSLAAGPSTLVAAWNSVDQQMIRRVFFTDVDIVPGMLEAGKEVLRALKIPEERVKRIQADMSHVPINEEQDAVVVGFALGQVNTAKRVETLKEAWRLTRVGGLVVLVEREGVLNRRELGKMTQEYPEGVKVEVLPAMWDQRAGVVILRKTNDIAQARWITQITQEEKEVNADNEVPGHQGINRALGSRMPAPEHLGIRINASKTLEDFLNDIYEAQKEAVLNAVLKRAIDAIMQLLPADKKGVKVLNLETIRMISDAQEQQKIKAILKEIISAYETAATQLNIPLTRQDPQLIFLKESLAALGETGDDAQLATQDEAMAAKESAVNKKISALIAEGKIRVLETFGDNKGFLLSAQAVFNKLESSDLQGAFISSLVKIRNSDAPLFRTEDMLKNLVYGGWYVFVDPTGQVIGRMQSYEIDGYAHLGDLGVLPKYQKLGIGRFLFNGFLKEERNKGVSFVAEGGSGAFYGRVLAEEHIKFSSQIIHGWTQFEIPKGNLANVNFEDTGESLQLAAQDRAMTAGMIGGILGRFKDIIGMGRMDAFLRGIRDLEARLESLKYQIQNEGAPDEVSNLLNEIQDDTAFDKVNQKLLMENRIDVYHDNLHKAMRAIHTLEESPLTDPSHNKELLPVLELLEEMHAYTEFLVQLFKSMRGLAQFTHFQPELEKVPGAGQLAEQLIRANQYMQQANIKEALLEWGRFYVKYKVIQGDVDKMLREKNENEKADFMRSCCVELNAFFGQYIKRYGLTGLRDTEGGAAIGRLVVIGSMDNAEEKLAGIKDPDVIVVLDQDQSNLSLGATQEAAVLFGTLVGGHMRTRAVAENKPYLVLPNAVEFLKPFDGQKQMWFIGRYDEKGAAELRLATPAEQDIAPALRRSPLVAVAVKSRLDYPLSMASPGASELSRLSLKELAELMGYKAAYQYFNNRETHLQIAKSFTLFNQFFYDLLQENPAVKRRLHDLFNDIDEKDKPQSVRKNLEGMQNLIKGMGQYLSEAQKKEIWQKLEEIKAEHLILRLSTGAEDLPDFPGVGAGVYASIVIPWAEKQGESYVIPQINKDDLIVKMFEAYASYWSFEAYADRRRYSIDDWAPGNALLIQEYYSHARYAVLIHTAEPSELDPNIMRIQIVPGAGRGLTGLQDQQALTLYYDKSKGDVASIKDIKKGFIRANDPRVQYRPKRLGKDIRVSPTGDIEKIEINESTYPGLMSIDKQIALAATAVGSALELEKLHGRALDIEGVIIPSNPNDSQNPGNYFVHVQSRSQANILPYREAELRAQWTDRINKWLEDRRNQDVRGDFSDLGFYKDQKGESVSLLGLIPTRNRQASNLRMVLMQGVLKIGDESFENTTKFYEFLMSLGEAGEGEGLLRRIFFYVAQQHRQFNDYFSDLSGKALAKNATGRKYLDLFLKMFPYAIAPIRKGEFNREWFLQANAYSLVKALGRENMQRMMPIFSTELSTEDMTSLLNQIDWFGRSGESSELDSSTFSLIKRTMYPLLGKRKDYQQILDGLENGVKQKVIAANPDKAMLGAIGLFKSREPDQTYHIDKKGIMTGSIYDEAFINDERRRAQEKPTIAFDLNGTLLLNDDTLRPGIIEQLRILKEKYRLVVMTAVDNKRLQEKLSKFPELRSLFDLFIADDNNRGPLNMRGPLLKQYIEGLYKEFGEATIPQAIEFAKPINLFGYKLLVDDQRFPGQAFRTYNIDFSSAEPVSQLAHRLDIMVGSAKIMVSSGATWQKDYPDDKAMKADETGGIDLTSNKFIQTKDAGESIKFHLDPAMLAQLQNAPGFVPVIIDMQPMTDLQGFLGLVKNQVVDAGSSG